MSILYRIGGQSPASKRVEEHTILPHDFASEHLKHKPHLVNLRIGRGKPILSYSVKQGNPLPHYR